MKRKMISVISLLVLVIFTFSMTACNTEDYQSLVLKASVVEQENTLVIQVEEVENSKKATLMNAMKKLQSEKKLTFSADKTGMITGIGGKSNGGNSYWMLYTTDEKMSNTAWGTYEYEGERLGSAILGATALIIESGETYIWAYQTFDL